MRWYLRFFRRKLTERHLDAELRFHLDQRFADLVAAGVAPEEARRQARLEFGGLDRVKEECRDVGASHIIETFAQDLRYGLRQFRRNPGFTLVAVLTLALGIGANTTMFSAISAILLRKPPVKDPDSLCSVASINRPSGSDLVWPSVPDFESWQRQNKVFEDMAASRSGREFTLTGKNEPEAVMGDYVSAGYFKVIGIEPVLGRSFLPREAETGSNHVVILSDALWHERYGSDPNVIGKRLDIEGVPHTIVGVMPRRASILFPWDAPRLWTPLAFTPHDLGPSERGDHNLTMVLARLKPGVTLQQAQAEMTSVAQRLAKTYPETNKHWGLTVLTLQEYMVRISQESTGLLVIMVAVGFVLLIACANVAGLLVARGTARAHEWAVRTSLGASRLRLARQMLAESLLIGAAGGAAGLILSSWGVQLLRAGWSFNSFGGAQARLFRVDRPTLLFTLAVSVLSAILFGLAPALRSSKVSLGEALSESGRTGSGLGRSRLRNALVAGEIALAVVLLAGAGLSTREVIWEILKPVGFNPQHLVIANLHLDGPGYGKAAARIALFEGVTERVRNLPGVESAGLDNCIPLGCGYSASFTIAGQPPQAAAKNPSANYFVVGPGYFRTMQIPLMKGREFSPSDNANAPTVAVVNQEFARRYFPKGDAIGQQIKAATLDAKPAQIVGIVGNVSEYLGQTSPSPQLYESDLQFPFTAFAGTSLIVRSRIGVSALVPALRRAIQSVDQDQPVTNIQTMNDIFAGNSGGDKFMAGLMGTFAGLALLLAVVGIYGVIAYLVTQRTREIGIRVALGARKRDVLGLVLRQGGLLTAIGCAAGFALALPLPRILAALYNGFPPHGALIAIAVALVVGTVALLATYIPARRATKVDPMVALRYE